MGACSTTPTETVFKSFNTNQPKIAAFSKKKDEKLTKTNFKTTDNELKNDNNIKQQLNTTNYKQMSDNDTLMSISQSTSILSESETHQTKHQNIKEQSVSQSISWYSIISESEVHQTAKIDHKLKYMNNIKVWTECLLLFFNQDIMNIIFMYLKEMRETRKTLSIVSTQCQWMQQSPEITNYNYQYSKCKIYPDTISNFIDQKEEYKLVENSRFDTSNISSDNILNKLLELGILRTVYVPKNEQIRWNYSKNYNSSPMIRKMNVDFDLNYSKCTDMYLSDKNCKKMYCFWLKNFHQIYGIKKYELKDFEEMILNGLKCCDKIYLLNFNSSKIDETFLKNILNVLGERDKMYDGPEIIDLQNIGINDMCIQLISKYLEKNVYHTKYIRIGTYFCKYIVTKELADTFAKSLKNNHYILKIDIKINGLSQQLSEIIKLNINEFEKNK